MSLTAKRVVQELDRLSRKSYFIEWNETTRTALCWLQTGACDPDEDDVRFACYANKRWRVSVLLGEEYPFRSPSVGFVDSIYHPNVDEQSGTICLNALNDDWTPMYDICAILEQLLPQLLRYPNPDDPLNVEAARHYLDSPKTFAETVDARYAAAGTGHLG